MAAPGQAPPSLHLLCNLFLDGLVVGDVPPPLTHGHMRDLLGQKLHQVLFVIRTIHCDFRLTGRPEDGRQLFGSGSLCLEPSDGAGVGTERVEETVW